MVLVVAGFCLFLFAWGVGVCVVWVLVGWFGFAIAGFWEGGSGLLPERSCFNYFWWEGFVCFLNNLTEN